MTIVLYGIEVKTVDDCSKVLATIADEDEEMFYSSDEYTCDWCPPSDWLDFHDFFCDDFESEEEYKEFEAFIDKMIADGVLFDVPELQEDPHEAGWYAWRTSRGI